MAHLRSLNFRRLLREEKTTRSNRMKFRLPFTRVAWNDKTQRLIPWSKLEYRNVFSGGRRSIGSTSRLGCLDAPVVLPIAGAARCRDTPRLKTDPSLNNPENSVEKALSSLFTDPPLPLLQVVERAYENKNRWRFIDRRGKGARDWEIREQKWSFLLLFCSSPSFSARSPTWEIE